MNTQLLLCEHVEKLEAAISLREQDPELVTYIHRIVDRIVVTGKTLLVQFFSFR
jgi:hypothetical protein